MGPSARRSVFWRPPFCEPPLNNVDQFRKIIEGHRPGHKPFFQNTHFSAAIAVSLSTRKSAKPCKGPKLDVPISLHKADLPAAIQVLASPPGDA